MNAEFAAAAAIRDMAEIAEASEIADIVDIAEVAEIAVFAEIAEIAENVGTAEFASRDFPDCWPRLPIRPLLLRIS